MHRKGGRERDELMWCFEDMRQGEDRQSSGERPESQKKQEKSLPKENGGRINCYHCVDFYLKCAY